MNLVQKFAKRIDNDSGYDNLLLAQDLAKIAKEHYAKQCNTTDVEEQNKKLKNFVEYCEKEHGLFIPSWMIDGYNKSLK